MNRSALYGTFLLASTSLLLGFIGYRSSAQPLAPDDAIFGALQLFVLDAPRDLDGEHWGLAVARFTAPLALVSATAVAVAAALGHNLRRAVWLLRARDHVVVIGLSDASWELVRELRARGDVVMVLEPVADHELLPSARAAGAVVVIGDALDDGSLRRVRCDRAGRVVISSGDDSRNLQIAAHATAMLPTEGGGATIHVGVRDHRLYAALGQVRLPDRRTAASIDLFHRGDREVATFLEMLEGGAFPPLSASTIQLVADGRRGRTTLVHLARRHLVTGARLTLTVDPGAEASVVEPVLRTHPWVADVLDVADAPGPAPRVAVVVTDGSDSQQLSVGLEVARDYGVAAVHVYTDDFDERSVWELRGLPPTLQVVAAGRISRTPELFFGHSWVETMARARHDIYCANEAARGETAERNPSMRPWAELPESLRESNRHFARSVARILEEAGGDLVPMQGDEAWPGANPLGADLLERLARDEHDRWAEDLRRDGWRWSPAPKDPEARTHPLLVDWEELDEVEREKDRDSVRAIPAMLALLGLRLEAPDARQTTRGIPPQPRGGDPVIVSGEPGGGTNV